MHDHLAAPPPPPAAPGKERTWPAIGGVLLVVLVVGFGGYVVAGAPSRAVTDPEPRPDARVEIVPGLTIAPLEGWRIGGRFAEPVEGGELQAVRIAGGDGTLDAFAGAHDGPPEDLLALYIDQVLRPGADQLRVSRALEAFTTDEGLRGIRGFYLGVFEGVAAPIEGEISAVATPQGLGLVTDGWTNEGQLAAVIDPMRAMVRSVDAGS